MALRMKLRQFKSAMKEWKRPIRYASTQSPVLSYYHQPGEEPLKYLTIGQCVSEAAHRWPDSDVFISVKDGTNLTFCQAEEKANKLAVGLLALGLQPGDRVAMCGPNSPNWFITALATAKAGLVLVSLNPAYRTQELKYCLEKVAVRAIIMDERFKSQDYYGMLCEILPGLAGLHHSASVKSNELPSLNFVIVNSENYLPGTFRLSDVQDSRDSLKELHEVEERLRPEHNANIQFTSGTTGNPKAVPISHFSLVNNSYFVGKRLDLNRKRHKILAQTPLFHVLGYVAGMMVSLEFGCTMILPSPTFKVADSLETIKKERCTLLLGTPTMYVDLCSHMTSLSPKEKELIQSPELAISAGSTCPSELIRKLKDTFSCQQIVSLYGLTETTAVIFQSTAADSEYHMTSTVGRVSEHVEAKVVDDEGLTVPLGTPGELWIRYPLNMAGYWGDPESSAKVTTADHWLKTGDRFILLEGGYGQIVGRIKDMIIRGGENISPKEIEEFLLTHPDIIDAQVYGVKDERLGEEIGCSLRVSDGAQLSVQQVKDFCKGKISHYKIPKYIEVVDTFPKTGSGKIQKFKLRKAMEEKLGINK